MRIGSLATKLSQLSAIISPLAGKVQDIKIGSLPAESDKNLTLFKALITDMETLTSKFVALNEMVKTINDLKKKDNSDALQRMSTIVDGVNNTNYDGKLQEYKASKDFPVINNLLLNVNSSISFLNSQPTMKKTAESIADALKNPDVLAIANQIFEVINSLNTIPEIKPVISAIKAFPEATSVPLVITSVAKILPDIKKDMKNLQTFVSKKNSNKTKESSVDILKELKNATVQLSVIGSVARGIFRMEQALGLTNDVSNMKSFEAVVKDEMSKVKLDGTDKKNMKVLIGLGDELEKLLSDLNLFVKSVKPSNSTNLADFAGIFEAAAKVKGVPHNFMAIKASGDYYFRFHHFII